MSAEFCPQCGAPLDTGGDDSRSCESCGWYGDRVETSPTPPDTDEPNPVLAVLQGLALYRDVCRDELVAEQTYDAGNITEATMRRIHMATRECRHSLVELFMRVRRPLPIVLKNDGGQVPWPKEWTDRHYNACNEPCDMLAGACACGAWHFPAEDWVREALTRHNAVIQ
jgi:hypothetical protein